MYYKKIHDAIIERAKNRKLDGYKERHHIVPRCIGGTDELDNLVELTAREHFVIHRLLCELYPSNDKLFYAYRMMAIMKNSKDNLRNYCVSSREFALIQERQSILLSERNKHRVVSQETKDKISATTRGKKRRPASQETKNKISMALKGRKLSNEHKESLRISHYGNIKNTGKASTPEKERERREKIKQSWVLRKSKQNGGVND